MQQMVLAQSYEIRWHRALGDTTEVKNNTLNNIGSISAQEAYEKIKKLVPELQQQGHLAASIDSVMLLANTYHIWYFTGPRFTAAKIILDSLPIELFSQNVISPKQWLPDIWDAKRISQTYKRIVAYYENNGYPFARVLLQDITIENKGVIKGKLVVQKGGKRHIDSIALQGGSPVKENFLLQYLDLKKGEPYNEKKLRSISNRLAELPYLRESQPWSVTFNHFDTRLNLFLQERKANQLNALIGLQPNTQATGKFLLTADVLLSLKNALGFGESFGLTYQNLQYRSPRIKVDAAWPYVLQSELGLDAGFELFRNELLFRKSAYRLGMRYQLNTNSQLRVYFQNQSNKLLQIDTALLKQSFMLPANADFKSIGGGAEVNINKTDYRLNPRRGWMTMINVLGTKRKVLENDEIMRLSTASENYKTLYDSANAAPWQAQITAELAAYLPLQQLLALKMAYYGGYLVGKQLFRNELYQIGGNRLLRGFDEQSLFVNQYQIASLELRYYLAQNSFVHLFSDNGYLLSQYSGYYLEGLHYGFGMGLAMENKSGLFTLSYALGGAPKNPIQLRQSKIHFGYVALF